MLPSQKVLIVEDDFFIRELYQRALSMHGLEVLTASDGKEAIELFDRERPGIVLLDVMLPELRGIEVLKYIKQKSAENGNVPVVMVSNLDTEQSVQEALDLGAHSYKVKAQTSPIAIAQEVKAILGLSVAV